MSVFWALTRSASIWRRLTAGGFGPERESPSPTTRRAPSRTDTVAAAKKSLRVHQRAGGGTLGCPGGLSGTGVGLPHREHLTLFPARLVLTLRLAPQAEHGRERN